MKKLLVVDDDQDIVKFVQTLLKDQFDISTACDGNTALEMVRKNKPDIILTDVLMPNMSGLDFYKKLKEIKSETGNIPIIVMSSRSSMSDFFDKWSIVQFLKKPFNAEQLRATVEKASGEIRDETQIKASETIPSPSEKSSDSSAKQRLAIIASVDEAVITSLRKFLSSKNFEVEIGLDEKDVYETARTKLPEIIICQCWEDPDRFNIEAIHTKLSEQKETKKIPFLPICIPALSVNAAQIFGRDRAIVFDSLRDLIKKIEPFLK